MYVYGIFIYVYIYMYMYVYDIFIYLIIDNYYELSKKRISFCKLGL